MFMALRPSNSKLRAALLIAFLASLSLAASGLAETCDPPQQVPAVPAELANPANTVSVSYESAEKDKGIFHYRGHVVITYHQIKITADEADYDESTGEVTARHHVTFDDPQSHFEADTAEYNVRTRKGTFTDVHGYVHSRVKPRPRELVTPNPFYIQAKKVDRIDPDTYFVEKGRLSSCQKPSKGWVATTSHARLDVDDKVVSHNDVIRLLNFPLIYAPLLVNSIQSRPRRTGFLLPHVGTSSLKGNIIGDGFYWAINPSMGLLLGLEDYSVRGIARRAVFDATPTDTSNLGIDYFGVNDKGGGPLRQQKAPGYSLDASGQVKDLWKGFRGVLDVDYISSLAFRFTFTDTFSEAVYSEARQVGFLTKDFGAYSMNVYTSRYQDFLSTALTPGNSVIIRQLPTLDFSRMEEQIGRSPFYLSFDASGGAVGRTEPGFSTPDLSERFDFDPALTLRTKPFLGFHFTPTASIHATRYGTSLLPEQTPITRYLGEVDADLRPPSLEKVMKFKWKNHRFKHVIEPDIRYRLVRADNREEINDIVRFDENDILTQTNEIEYSLTNTILTRDDPTSPTAATPQAREFLSWSISEKYYFDPTFGGAIQPGKTVYEPTISLTGFAFPTGQRLSPIVSILKLDPTSSVDVQLRTDVSPTGDGLLNAGISSSAHHGPVGVSVTDFFINKTGILSTLATLPSNLSSLHSANLLRTLATYGNPTKKGLSGAFGMAYDFAQGIPVAAVSQVTYNFGCFGVDFQYQRYSLGPLRRENLFRIALSFANVGTFGNLRGRERLY